MNPLKIAHALWKEHLKGCNKPTLVDATCGNGHDALFLTSLEGKLHCIDIQEKALLSTKNRLSKHTSIQYHLKSHEDLSFIEGEIDLIVYNLGYLPGGDKEIITLSTTTVSSLSSAITKLSPTGMISIMMYTGHEGGLKERNDILNFIKNLPPSYSTSHITNPNKPTCPEILLIS